MTINKINTMNILNNCSPTGNTRTAKTAYPVPGTSSEETAAIRGSVSEPDVPAGVTQEEGHTLYSI